MKTEVTLRAENTSVPVSITDSNKPAINVEFSNKWQRIVNILADIMEVPAGLIMQITNESMEVFLKSSNPDNPYKNGESANLRSGLYCETVIGSNATLLVPDALSDEKWRDNPDVSLGMISYLGMPIQWPDGELFGTICVLDNKRNNYNQKYISLMEEFQSVLQTDLHLLIREAELKKMAERDHLTGIFNRGKIETLLKEECERSNRYETPFSILLIDLNRFKEINDHYGHTTGDNILTTFTTLFQERIRTSDSFGRWGGDEFLLICPGIGSQGAEALIDRAYNDILQGLNEIVPNVSFSYGSAEYSKGSTWSDLIIRADKKLYVSKKNLYSKN